MPTRAGQQALQLARELVAEEETRWRRSSGPESQTPRSRSSANSASGAEGSRRGRLSSLTGSAIGAGATAVTATPSSGSGRPVNRQRSGFGEQLAQAASATTATTRTPAPGRITPGAAAGGTRSQPPTPANTRVTATRTGGGRGPASGASGSAAARPIVAAGRASLRRRASIGGSRPGLPSSQNSPARGSTPIDDEAFARQLAQEDEALARQLAHEEDLGARDQDEEMALALAREFEEADARTLANQIAQRNAQMETAIVRATSGRDMGSFAAAAAAAAAAGMPPEALLSIPGLGEMLMMEHLLSTARSEQPGVERQCSLSKEQLQRLPTRRASAHMEEDCPVCFATYEEGEELRTLPCLHVFHTECIDQWLTRCRAGAQCPVCHTKVDL